MSLSTNEFLAAMRQRYSVKSFDPSRTVDAITWDALEQSLVLTPSSYGLQPWKFLVIQDLPLRQRLKPHSWNQSQITDCSHLVVFLRRTTIEISDVDAMIESTHQSRPGNKSSLMAYRSMIINDLIDEGRSGSINLWASNQIYIALGNLLTSAAMLGVDACPIEGFESNSYDRILKIDGGGYKSCVLCALGVRSSTDKYASLAKVRFAAEKVIERR